MSEAHRERVFAIFAEAIERAPSERAAWLDEACRGEPALRSEVDELLAFDAETRAPSLRLAPEREERASDAVPERVGRYTIDRVLGAGGMGLVYAAHDKSLGRTVALKLVRGGGDAVSRARLLREAQAMARIASPFVVPVYEVGLEGDDVFVAMEHVDGSTLSRWLDAEPRPQRAILERFIEAGRGLAAAHKAGVLHRDFKGSNVLVGSDGRARVLDFGLARGIDPDLRSRVGDASSATLDAKITAHGSLMGTPGYLSPEHFTGDFRAESDQWRYCAALYRALFGALPCEGETLASLRESVSRGPKQPPIERASEFDPVVVRAVMRGLSPDPASRWPSMDALVSELASSVAVSRDADPRAFRRQKQWALAIVGALGALNYAVQLARTGGRFDLRISLRSIAIAFFVLAVMCAAFRRTLLSTRHNRALLSAFALVLATMVVHRAYGVLRGLDVVDVLRIDALICLTVSAVSAIALERWLWGTVAIMASYLALSALGPLATQALFPAALLTSAALAVWNWRAPTLRELTRDDTDRTPSR
ncbi:MAG: serine/threonine protein kinase [Myxococcales bacterium]|nr:serine/threonine protein kinase [Myxococcales bacterium]